jgi:hypothetical protein
VTSSPRYQLLDVETKGYRVAVILDTRYEVTYRIRQKGTKFLFWDRQDAPVKTPALRRVAREALA